MKVCKRVLYQGQVQGVGFRYTTHGLAQKFAVTGYVRNLPDGRVELMVEGECAEIERLLDSIDRQMSGYIATRHEHDQPTQGFTTFEIRL